jgi:hypothetical protein
VRIVRGEVADLFEKMSASAGGRNRWVVRDLQIPLLITRRSRVRIPPGIGLATTAGDPREDALN